MFEQQLINPELTGSTKPAFFPRSSLSSNIIETRENTITSALVILTQHAFALFNFHCRKFISGRLSCFGLVLFECQLGFYAAFERSADRTLPPSG